MNAYGRLWLLMLVMATVAVLVASIALTLLYQAAMRQQQSRLVDTVQSQARLIEAIARFQQQSHRASSHQAEAATLRIIEDAHRHYLGFGATGGFAVGRLEGDQIQFLHSHRAGLQPPAPVPLQADEGEPMRRALRGEQGTIIGPDYLGTTVLAAYEPVAAMELGIVAKIDLAELQTPFVRAALAAAGAGLVVVLLGAVFFLNLTNPMIRQLHENEERFRTMVEQAAVGVALVETNSGRFVRINRKYCELLGVTPEQMASKTWEDILPANSRHELQGQMKRLVEGRLRQFSSEASYLRPDQSQVWVDLTVSPTWPVGAAPTHHIAIVQDISERKRAAETARREHELSQSIIETAQIIILVLDTQGRIVRYNPFMEELTGWRLDETAGQDWFETFLPADSRPTTRDLFHRAVRGERTRGNQGSILTRQGRLREIDWYDAPLTDADGQLIGLLCTGSDVTERRKLQREILEIAAEEQRRIGQDLHDSTQQQLTGLGLLVQNIATALGRLRVPAAASASQMPEAAPAPATDLLERLHEKALQVQQGLEQAAREVHQLARGLIPVEVDSRGLMSALTDLSQSVSEVQQVSCRFDCREAIEVTDNFVATHLYRIAQEAVNNALRHGKSKQIEISLQKAAHGIQLRIRDNGRGIMSESHRGPGMGLRIMDYRASMIQASLHVGPSPTGGTEVVCRLRPD